MLNQWTLLLIIAAVIRLLFSRWADGASLYGVFNCD
jgi:hypothetical protein